MSKEMEELKDSLEELNTALIESMAEPDDGKPYTNEFSCSVNPGPYDRFARQNCKSKHNGKCIDFLYGIKGGKSKLASMRYKKAIWDKSAAKSHCSSHKGKFEG